MPHISVVSPVYKAEDIVDELVKRIIDSVSKITDDFEIILVEDSSPDNSWQKIKDNCITDNRIKGIQLSRNFGQHYAITAGTDNATGDWVVVIDCDLQDRPEEIKKLYHSAITQNYDAVIAKRSKRNDSLIKKISSYVFYRILSYLTGTKHDHAIANFGIYNKNIINSVSIMRESIRYFPTMIKWVGFKIGYVNVEHSERLKGKTSYNFKKLLHLALDIIMAYSDKPMRLTIKLGLSISFLSFIFAIYNIYKAWHGDIAVMGYASLIVSVWFLAGMIMVVLGVVGLYIGKTFEGVKNRPIYIVKEKVSL